MSHEIRTPLNAVIGFSELLKSNIVDEKQRSYIETINAAGNSLLLIINDILDLSKVEAGKIELQLKPIELNVIFKEIENIFRQKVKSKNIEFFIDIDKNFNDVIMLDEVRVRQILLNLTGNAVKFTEQGYVKLSLRVIGRHINSLDLRISVEDTGIGIPEGEKEKIFEAFRQVSGQSIKKFGGTGLGLSITKKLTEVMQGKIFMESIEDKGSSFHVEFYNVQIAPQEELTIDEAFPYFQKYYFSNEKVLVADDVEDNLFLLQEMLSKAGLRVITAETGSKAYEICKKEQLDLIILDVVMPDMDGRELSNILKEDANLCSIPIIALSASAAQEACEGCNFDEYLMKPFNTEQLMSIISKYLPNKAAKHSGTFSEPQGHARNLIEIDTDILEDFKEKINPLLEKLETSIILSNVKNLAALLISFGQQHDLKSLYSDGEELMKSAESCNIIKIKTKLMEIKKANYEGWIA